MTDAKSVFAVLRGDSRTGDILHTLKLFWTYDQARAYADKIRKDKPDTQTYVVLQETFIEPEE